MDSQTSSGDTEIRLPIKKEIDYEGNKFYINIMKGKEEESFIVQVLHQFSDVYWEKELSYDQLLKEDMKWINFENKAEVLLFLNQALNNPNISYIDQDMKILFELSFWKKKVELSLILKAFEVDLKKSFTILSESVKTLINDMNTLDDKVSSAIKESDELKEIREEISEIKNTINKFETSLEKLNSNVEKSLSSSIKSIKDENEHLAERINGENIEKEALKARVEVLERKLTEFQELFLQIMKSNEKVESTVTALNKRQESIENILRGKLDKNKEDELLDKINQLNDFKNQTTQKIVEIADISHKINSLTQANTTNNNQINNINNQIATIKGSMESILPGIKLDTKFVSPDTNVFNLTNNGKTIEKKANDGSWHGVMCGDRFNFNGTIQEFSVRFDAVLNNAYDQYIMIGLAASTATKNPSYYNVNQTWMAYLATQHGYINGSNTMLGFLSYAKYLVKDDILSVCLDTSKCEFYLKLNGQIISVKRKLTIDESLKDKIFPCIDFYKVGHKLTII